MAAMLAARVPDKIVSLVLAASPIAPHAGIGPLGTMVQQSPMRFYVAEFGSQLVAAPVRRAVRRLVPERAIENPRFALGHGCIGATRDASRSYRPLAQKTVRPAREKSRLTFEPAQDRLTRRAVIKLENPLRSASTGQAHRPAAHDCLQLISPCPAQFILPMPPFPHQWGAFQ